MNQQNVLSNPFEMQQMGVGACVHLLLVEHLLCAGQWMENVVSDTILDFKRLWSANGLTFRTLDGKFRKRALCVS